MKKLVCFFTILILLLSTVPFAAACHPDRHFGILVAVNETAQTFAIVHLGDDPEMGGKFFVFSAKAPLLKELTLGAKIAVQFVAERDHLIAKEAKEIVL
ncbi:MAG: hypothetical protein ACE5J1_04095 [Nitrospiria bacterium]